MKETTMGDWIPTEEIGDMVDFLGGFPIKVRQARYLIGSIRFDWQRTTYSEQNLKPVLVSNKSKSITGQHFYVDRGLHLREVSF